jgi:subtilisin family serine protease
MAAKSKGRTLKGFPVYSTPFPDYVVVELRYESQVAFAPATMAFSAPAAQEDAKNSLNKILEDFDVKLAASHFGMKKKQLDLRAVAAPTPAMVEGKAPVSDEFALSGFVQIQLKNPKDCGKLVKRLQKDQAVWTTYVAPRPEPAGAAAPAPGGDTTGSRNFEPAQGYLHDAPNGIGAMAVWDSPCGAGKGVTICDIEGNWLLDHEDLPDGIKLIGGEVIDDPGWRNHGTAVLGEMVSLPDNVGCVGISHDAKVKVHSAMINGVFNAAGAIVAAANTLKPGDVILIELHANGGPDNKLIAMQFWSDIFAAIRTAVAAGIVVVEAGGNGNENFDRPEYANTGLQQDAGAIVVGAGVPPTNYFDTYGFGTGFPPYSRIGMPRSRIWFSNYGQIVNVQGWGFHVTTLAYGDAQGGRKEQSWYTHRFSGTSSASPIVAGAAACLQGLAKAKQGNPLLPGQVRDILMKTGTPQEADPSAPLAQHIGPLPNLAKAIAELG